MSTVESIARPRRNGERRRAPTASISKESPAITGVVEMVIRDRKSGSAGMPRPISYAVFCLKKKKNGGLRKKARAPLYHQRHLARARHRVGLDGERGIASEDSSLLP